MPDLLYHHSIMLNDEIRMRAYGRAIAQVVKPGDVVVDIGCGLGVLSFLALKAGAKKVYAIEADSPTLQLARKFAEQNHFLKQITFIKKLSGQVRLPEKADVIVSEILGSLAIDENILPTLLDAKKRFLKKGGKVIPEQFSLYAVPVDSTPWTKTLARFKNIQCYSDPGLDPGEESSVSKISFLLHEIDTPMDVRTELIPPEYFLSKPQCLAQINLLQNSSPSLNCQADFNIERPGTLSGFAGWFETQLFGHHIFSTAPTEAPTHWKQAFLPLKLSEPVTPGKLLKFFFTSDPDRIPPGPDNIITYGYELD
ncbi:MAG: 50S ribosomal protein L11 methyltransferase [Deltaproteobacteria bacterium]|nr:50S ribosomal protein L11 methyltransferase [Deltaproteobacteria bacterium]